MIEKIRNIIIVVLICIIVALTLLLGFVLGIRYANKETEVVQNTEENNKLSEDKLYEVANNLYTKISGLYLCGEPELQLPNNKISSNEFSREYINRYVIGSILNSKNIKGEEILKYNVSVNEFETEFKKVFGSNVTFELPQTFYISYFKFDLSGNNYIASTMSMGCETSTIGEYYLKDYEEEDGKINLIVYLLHSIGNDQYILNSNTQTYTKEEILKNYESEIIKYKYTFKIENDNYLFESIERV